MVTLEQVRSTASPDLYPRDVLQGCETALVLFAAAWHGKQDAVWIAEAGLTATCVDTDKVRLEEMRAAYPDGWEYVTADVFQYIATTKRSWDVVSIDCPSNLFDECNELVPLWCLLAKRAVILGTGVDTLVEPPKGWQVTDVVRRSSFLGGVYWTVLERKP